MIEQICTKMSSEKKKRVDKKSRLTEVEKPRGFDRELSLDEIVGATDYTGELMFLVRWENCTELDLIAASEVNEKSPQDVIKFYEKRCPINRKAKDRDIPNIPIIPDLNTPPIISKVEQDDEITEAQVPE